MTRRILTTTMVLGVLITLLGFGGIYAVFTDRATTGTTGGDSAALPPGADIEIARALSAVDCPAVDYADDLTSALVQWTDVKPGDDLSTHWFCVKNVGIANVTLAWSLIDLTSTEVDCTGDEATAGDATCTIGAAGELGPVLWLTARRYDCSTGAGTGTTTNAYVSFASVTPIAVVLDTASLAPDGVVCLSINTSYPDYANGTSVAEAQVAQSDQISWRFAFDATEE